MNREDKAIGWHLNLAIRVNPPLADDNELLDLIERLARRPASPLTTRRSPSPPPSIHPMS